MTEPNPTRTGLALVLERWLIEAEANLQGWRENPPGFLVPTEPDVEQRALVRIGLRAQIYTLRKALDMPADAAESEQHRDLQRIRDAAQAEQLERLREEGMIEIRKIDPRAPGLTLRGQLQALFDKHGAKLVAFGERLYTVDDIMAICEGRTP